jgi:hypothetical protein
VISSEMVIRRTPGKSGHILEVGKCRLRARTIMSGWRLTEDGKVYRRGRKRYPNNDVYEGEFVDGKREVKCAFKCCVRAAGTLTATPHADGTVARRGAECFRTPRAISTSESSKRTFSTVRRHAFCRAPIDAKT